MTAAEKGSPVKIEILHIADCPNWEETRERARLAVLKTKHPGTIIETTLIDSPHKAATLHFAGSPTILVDGTDLFPSEGATQDLACRIYFTPNGLAGGPTQEQLEKALITRG